MAAALGAVSAVASLLASDPASATRKTGPYGWDPLTWLCFSRYLRLERHRARDFVEAATLLLDAGADPSTGWREEGHQPAPVWESALYGAAGVAHQPELTRLLLERGADPNDEETPYHAPENWDIETVRVLAESGRLTADSLATMLLRKADWHHLEGVRLLLDHGADPNRMTRWGRTALQQAILRDNDLAIIEAMLGWGGDPLAGVAGRSAVAMAARRGRADLLAMLGHRGTPLQLEGVDRLIAACASGDIDSARHLATSEPGLAAELLRSGGQLLAEFAGNDNAAGVACLIDLGVDPASRFGRGDGYWQVAPGSTALHVAAWRGAHRAVAVLVGRGAPVNLADGWGRTPLGLALKAAVDSYWAARRAPDSLRTLLAAGASTEGLSIPTDYPAADALLARSDSTSGS